MSKIVEYKVHGKNRRWNKFFGVQSSSNPDMSYTVSVKQDTNKFSNWACSCPRWTRNADRPECKHIRQVKERINFYGDKFMPEQTAAPASVQKFVEKYENAFQAIELD